MKEFVCIVCPSSCRLQVEEINGEIKVSGNTCKRGEAHGRLEYSNPKRMLTTTVAVLNGRKKRLSVVSHEEIQKNKLSECLQELYKLKIEAPINMGDVIISNICGTGVDIIAAHVVK